MTRSEPTVLVVAYGRPDLLEIALTALGAGREMIVVDNGASDATAAVVRRAGARYLRAPGNVGFAAGVNLGLRCVEDGRDVLLLNPDARLDWSAVLTLQQALHAPGRRLAAVAPRLVRPDGSVEPTTWPSPTPLMAWLSATGRARAPDAAEVFVSGAVLLLRADAVREVGEFDERFFLYAEECDWQRRAQRAGWSVRAVDEVAAVHAGAGTSTDPALRDTLFHAAAELFVRKWHGRWGWQIFRAGSLVAALRRLLVSGLRDSAIRRQQVRTLRLYLRGPVRSLPTWARR